MNQSDISRIIEMAWEDRTPFDAIEIQFGLNEQAVKELMRANLKLYFLSILAKKSFLGDQQNIWLREVLS